MTLSCLWVDDDRVHLHGVSGFLKDSFVLVSCSNYSEALVEWQRRTFEVLVLDLIIPFGAVRPSVEPYLGLSFAEEILRDGDRKPKVVAFFTVVKDPVIDADIENLKALQKNGVVIEYFNKTEVLLWGVENFVGHLVKLAQGDGR